MILEEIASAPPREGLPVRLGALKKRLAVVRAHWLLVRYDRPIHATKSSDFPGLAALLYGDRAANLVSQCKARISAARKSKKSGTK